MNRHDTFDVYVNSIHCLFIAINFIVKSLKRIFFTHFVFKTCSVRLPSLSVSQGAKFLKLTVKKLINWVEATLDKKTHILTDGTFEHDTQASTGATTGDWFVLFHNTSCTTKLIIEPIWEQAAIK